MQDDAADGVERSVARLRSPVPESAARDNCAGCWRAPCRSGRGCGRATARAAARLTRLSSARVMYSSPSTNLKLVKPPAQHREHRRHAAAHHQCAAGEGRVAAFVLVVEQRHQKSLLSGPTSRRWIRFRSARARNVEQDRDGELHDQHRDGREAPIIKRRDQEGHDRSHEHGSRKADDGAEAGKPGEGIRAGDRPAHRSRQTTASRRRAGRPKAGLPGCRWRTRPRAASDRAARGTRNRPASARAAAAAPWPPKSEIGMLAMSAPTTPQKNGISAASALPTEYPMRSCMAITGRPASAGAAACVGAGVSGCSSLHLRRRLAGGGAALRRRRSGA